MNLEIANRLTETRKKNGLSQEELADRLGISRQAVSKWERGEASPDTDNLIALAKIYGTSLDDLLDLEKPLVESSTDKQEDSTESGNDERSFSRKIEGIIIWSTYLLYLVIYIALGCINPNMWVLLWPGFMFPTAIGTLVSSIMDRNPDRFAYPMLVTGVYCFIGTSISLWHPTWVMFLTIPMYYAIIKLVRYLKDRKR